MSTYITRVVFALTFAWSIVLSADERPYITTKSEITMLSANDGETDPAWRTTLEGLTDYEVKTRDSFTVIRLGPDHPPLCHALPDGLRHGSLLDIGNAQDGDVLGWSLWLDYQPWRPTRRFVPAEVLGWRAAHT